MDKQLRIDEVAAVLGMSRRTVENWIFTRQIRFTKIGKKSVRIPESEIKRIVAAGMVEPVKVG